MIRNKKENMFFRNDIIKYKLGSIQIELQIYNIVLYKYLNLIEFWSQKVK